MCKKMIAAIKLCEQNFDEHVQQFFLVFYSATSRSLAQLRGLE